MFIIYRYKIENRTYKKTSKFHKMAYPALWKPSEGTYLMSHNQSIVKISRLGTP